MRNPEVEHILMKSSKLRCHSSERKRIIQAGTTNAFGVANEFE